MPQKILGNAWKERRPYSSFHVITALSLLDLRKFERFGASLRNPLLYQGRQKSMQENLFSTEYCSEMGDAWGVYDIGNYRNGPGEKRSLCVLINDRHFRKDTGFQIRVGCERC